MRGELPSQGLPPLLGGILVGGQSRRMGRDKALLEWQGETFVARIAETLGSVVPAVFRLGAATGLPPSVAALPTLDDLPGVRGPLAGLLAAFAFRPDSAWLVLTCDQPRLTPATLRWLAGERRCERSAVLPRLVDSRIEPFPGIYEPGSRDALAALAAPGASGSLQPLAGMAGVGIVDLPEALRGELAGVNTPEELQVLLRAAPPGEAASISPRRGGGSSTSR
jgi:molybdopterin-guanine dinucleotide biosynthesis protein A